MTTASYLVQWEIQVDATSPEEAAKIALEIQRDPNSLATIFLVGRENSLGQFPDYMEPIDASKD